MIMPFLQKGDGVSTTSVGIRRFRIDGLYMRLKSAGSRIVTEGRHRDEGRGDSPSVSYKDAIVV